MNEPISSPKSAVILLMGVLSMIWLLNPPLLGTLDDNIPILGNLDEAAAALILINCLKYFGFDLTRLFQAGQRGAAQAGATPSAHHVVEVESEVVSDKRR